MGRTTLGDRRPYAGGHWLMTLRALPSTRVWWAATEAIEEYEDALLAAFADTVPASERAALRDPEVVLPFANLRRPTGERKASGLSGSLLPEAVEPPRRRPASSWSPTATRRARAASRRRHVAARRGHARRPPPSPTSSRAGGGGSPSAPGAARPPEAPPMATPGGPAATLTAEGAERLRAELAELTGVKRPEVIARIRAAKELGDLKENADYSSAREEQSFLEGRVQSIEAQLRTAVIAVAPTAGVRRGPGFPDRRRDRRRRPTPTRSSARAEADPSSGRLSVASPVGRALLGARRGRRGRGQDAAGRGHLPGRLGRIGPGSRPA